MQLSRLSLALLGVALALWLPIAPAQAQATRTWVSGVGDDANPCSRTAPCKTFAGAISKTAPGGEIDALDPGGFGALTITKSITLDGGGGQVASVLVAGTNGITVAAQASDVVIIRNMRLDGLLGGGNGNAGLNGISYLSGKSLTLDHVDIFGFATNGINIASSTPGSLVAINNTTINNISKSCINAASSPGSKVIVSNTRAWSCNFGIAVATGNTVDVVSSTFSNATSAALETDPGGSLFASTVTATQSGIGIQALGTVAITNSDITYNGTGISGATTSYVNNRIFGNTGPGTAPTAASPGQQ